MDWIDLAHDRDQWEGFCEHVNESSGSIKCWDCTVGGFSRRAQLHEDSVMMRDFESRASGLFPGFKSAIPDERVEVFMAVSE
jgi:hypothetical protein